MTGMSVGEEVENKKSPERLWRIERKRGLSERAQEASIFFFFSIISW
jgi:hypothetical protein